MGILLNEGDSTPDWDEELTKIAENTEEIEEIIIPKEEDKTEQKLLEMKYDITIPEEDVAFRLFQKMFVYKSNVVKTVLFSIVIIITIIQLIRGESVGYMLGIMAIAAGAITVVWLSPIRIRKALLQALEALKDDRYIFRMYENHYEIETILPDDEFEEGEEREKIPVQKANYDDSSLKIIETDEMFMLFIEKETYFILPKRCMSKEEVALVKDKLSLEIEDYTER